MRASRARQDSVTGVSPCAYRLRSARVTGIHAMIAIRFRPVARKWASVMEERMERPVQGVFVSKEASRFRGSKIWRTASDSTRMSWASRTPVGAAKISRACHATAPRSFSAAAAKVVAPLGSGSGSRMRKGSMKSTPRGAPIRLPPTNFSWALEIQVEDPDGNVLRFGSEPR